MWLRIKCWVLNKVKYGGDLEIWFDPTGKNPELFVVVSLENMHRYK